MYLQSIILVFLSVVASRVSGVTIESQQQVEPIDPQQQQLEQEHSLERHLQSDIQEVSWLLVLTLQDGAILDPDATFCTNPGFRNAPVSFYKFVHDVSTVIAVDFLEKYTTKMKIKGDIIWTLDIVGEKEVGRRNLMDKEGAGHRDLLTGYVFNLQGKCMRRLCNPDNRDARRRLGSSNNKIRTLSDHVSKMLYALLRKRCGISDLTEVTLELISR